jgi:hypothetical protein
VFVDNIALAAADREQSQSKFDNAKSLDFEKRKLNGEFSLSRVFEARLKRTGNRYDGLNKRACVIDEIIEIFHKTFARYPMPKTIDNFVRMGTTLGIAEMSNRFADMFYNNGS